MEAIGNNRSTSKKQMGAAGGRVPAGTTSEIHAHIKCHFYARILSLINTATSFRKCSDGKRRKRREKDEEKKQEVLNKAVEFNEALYIVVAPRRGRRRPIFPKGSLLKKPQQPRLACLFFPCFRRHRTYL